MRAVSSFAPATGYLSILIAPGLLVAATMLDKPLLVFGAVLTIFPLARVIFGAYPASVVPDWTESARLSMDRFPHAYAVGLTLAIITLLLHWAESPPSLGDIVAWALSLWAVLVFATCVSHDLIHRRSATDRMLGHVIAGLSLYPVLGFEHLRHHRLPGNTAMAEWPRRDESAWRFACRRLRRVLKDTVGRDGLAWSCNAHSPSVPGLRLGLGVTAVTCTSFAVVAGWSGAAIIALAMLLVAFSVQIVTYIQHWGLGDDRLPDARARELAWEDDCRFQAWVTLNLSLHQGHHRHPARAYYLATLTPGAPRLPAGYVLLLLAALWPRLWRRLMLPALAYWMSQPTAAPSAGRSLTCIGVYRQLRPGHRP